MNSPAKRHQRARFRPIAPKKLRRCPPGNTAIVVIFPSRIPGIF